MVADTECALSGILVTDFSRILTGPLATLLPMWSPSTLLAEPAWCCESHYEVPPA